MLCAVTATMMLFSQCRPFEGYLEKTLLCAVTAKMMLFSQCRPLKDIWKRRLTHNFPVHIYQSKIKNIWGFLESKGSVDSVAPTVPMPMTLDLQ